VHIAEVYHERQTPHPVAARAPAAVLELDARTVFVANAVVAAASAGAVAASVAVGSNANRTCQNVAAVELELLWTWSPDYEVGLLWT